MTIVEAYRDGYTRFRVKVERRLVRTWLPWLPWFFDDEVQYRCVAEAWWTRWEYL